MLQNLDRSTAQLSQATMNRVLKQAIYDVVRSGDSEAISQLSGTQMGANGQGVNDSLNLIQSLRQQEATLSSQIEQESTRFGPGVSQAHPGQSLSARGASIVEGRDRPGRDTGENRL